jgi:hypothetical protein
MSHLAQAGSASSWEMWCDPEARERFMSVVKTAAMAAGRPPDLSFVVREWFAAQ